MEREKTFVQMAISRIQILDDAISAVLTQSPAPRISKIVREAMRQAFRHLQVQRVVGRAAWIRAHDRGRILRIGDDEVVGKPISGKQSTGFAGRRGRGIESAGKLSDIPIRKERLENSIRAQSRRSREGSSVDYPLSQIGIRPGIERNAIQHLIEQRSVATGTGDVERAQNAVLENIHVVNGHSAVEVCALAADVAGLNCEISRQFALNFNVE